MQRLLATALAILVMLAAPAHGAPRRYLPDAERSAVRFHFTLDGIRTTGTIPVLGADVTLDMARLARSSVDVRLDARQARAGIFIVTEALRGASVLDAANHPEIVSDPLRCGRLTGARWWRARRRSAA